MKTYTITASIEAQHRLEAFYNEIVDRRKSGELADVVQYASRYGEQAARIALTLHAGLHGVTAHLHPLALETAENAVTLAKWFAEQQLGLLAKGRHTASTKVEIEVLKLLDDRMEGRRLEPEERKLGHCFDYITARHLQRTRIALGDAATALLAHLEANGLLVSEDTASSHGGRAMRKYRVVKNPVPG